MVVGVLMSSLLVSLAGEAGAVTVSGTVRDQDGIAIEGALVALTNESDPTHFVARTSGRDGSYEIDLFDNTLVAVTQAFGRPSSFQLFQNYPNPFNAETIIPFQLPRDARVHIDVYNSLGQHVRALVSDDFSAGTHLVKWNGIDDKGWGTGAGTYFYQMRTEGFVHSGKMLLLDGNQSVPATTRQLIATGTRAPTPVGKALALSPLFTVTVTGEGFFDYRRTGVAIGGNTFLDILVNSSTDMGMVRLGLTDAPVDGADAVNITISTVDIKRSEGGGWETFAGEPRTFDLLALRGGISALLGEQVVEAGEFTGVRLIVDAAEIVIDDTPYPLEVPSGEQSGLKLQGRFTVVPGETLDLMLDFDARKSIVQRGRGMDFLLKPVIRLLSTPESGSIAGRVVFEGPIPGDADGSGDSGDNEESGSGGGADGTTIAIEQSTFTGIGAGETVSITFLASGMVGVAQYSITLDVSNREHFDLDATTFEAGLSGFFSPGVVFGDDGRVTLGAGRFRGATDGSGALGTVTFQTSSTFTTDSEATIQVARVTIGASATDREEFEADDLNLSVTINSAEGGEAPAPRPEIPEIQATVLALQNGEEISSAIVDRREGTYRIPFLPAGTYDLQIEPMEGFVASPLSIDGVSVVDGEETRVADFTLMAGEGESTGGLEGANEGSGDGSSGDGGGSEEDGDSSDTEEDEDGGGGQGGGNQGGGNQGGGNQGGGQGRG